ncbi:MAG TPA: zinc ribbon domain-containing protein [Vicinamibacterales bacterium]|nr:zinc ribbon domain-containing protein [Vicinamibacterales bacterium]
MDASSLHCPNCGAAADPDARRCPYCQARLATVSCPACFALMFEGAAFCPKCGVRRERADGAAASAPCPGCEATMRRVDLGDASFLECERCDAVWIEAATFERLCANREAQAAVLHKLERRTAPPGGPVRYRKCPQCGTMMNRINFARMSGTIVDVCRGHGTFLDAGELHGIVSFIQAGGLERARERQIQDLKEQEQRLRDLELRTMRDRGTPDLRRTSGFGTSWDASAIANLLDALGRKAR